MTNKILPNPEEKTMNLIPFKQRPTSPSSVRNIENELSSLQWQMENMMNELWEGGSIPSDDLRVNLSPPLDIQDFADKYVLEIEVPGLDEDDLNLDLHNNILTIKGEKESLKSNKRNDYLYKERRFGSFRRDIPFDDEIKAEKVKAELKKGVLKIELVKKNITQETHKSIPIKH